VNIYPWPPDPETPAEDVARRFDSFV